MKAALLVLGASGIVGRGIVQAAVEAGQPLIAVARDPAGLEQLRAAHAGADIAVLAGSMANDEEAAVLATAIRDLGRPVAGAVVAVAGFPVRGRLLDQPSDMLRCKLDADLLPHLVAARALLPLLAEAGRGGSYVLIGGPGSELPWAGYGHRSVAAAALRMLACVLHDEAHALGIRVQLLSVDAPVRIEAQRAGAGAQWPTAATIGRRALALVERQSTQPAHPVVPCSARARPASGQSPAPSRPQAQASPGVGAADAGGVAGANERSLRDARWLLHSITSRTDEAFRHDPP
jgi:NAD(P)-dependent dehydrogenase (short-subunit alcohol dehydrogenase family)